MNRKFIRIVTAAGVGLIASSLVGCSTFDALLGPVPTNGRQQVESSIQGPEKSTEFASLFTDMGSVHPKLTIGDQLEIELDVWTEQKTHDWYTNSAKIFSFVINAFDRRTAASAPFDTKRRVYMSQITVTATTVTSTGRSETPFILQADPLKVTLDPEALRSEYGLLITSPKGGFQLESNQIGSLAKDTYGITLDFAMTISTESSAGSGNYLQQVVHQSVPIAIFSLE